MYDYNKLSIYLFFLEDLQNDNTSYKNVFTNIFSEVRKLSLNEIDFTKVSSSTFDIVSLLFFEHGDFFKSIDPDNLKLEEYKQIYKFLQEDIKKVCKYGNFDSNQLTSIENCFFDITNF